MGIGSLGGGCGFVTFSLPPGPAGPNIFPPNHKIELKSVPFGSASIEFRAYLENAAKYYFQSTEEKTGKEYSIRLLFS